LIKFIFQKRPHNDQGQIIPQPIYFSLGQTQSIYFPLGSLTPNTNYAYPPFLLFSLTVQGSAPILFVRVKHSLFIYLLLDIVLCIF